MLKLAPKGGAELLSGAFDRKMLQSYAADLTNEGLLNALDVLQGRLGSLRDGREPKTAAELCIIELCEPKLGGGVGALSARVADMEKAISALAAGVGCAKSAITTEPEHRKRPACGAEPDCTGEAASASDEAGASAPEIIPQDEAGEAVAGSAEQAESTAAELPNGDVPPLAEEALEDSAAGASGDGASAVWTALVAALGDTMRPGQYSIVSNSQQVSGAFSGDLLTIRVSNAFVRGQLEQQESLACIQAAAQKLTGGNIRVAISEEQTASQDGAAKLDRLSQFGNVRFERNI
jgi:DNA polymerase-3 subunit gamma/tau